MSFTCLTACQVYKTAVYIPLDYKAFKQNVWPCDVSRKATEEQCRQVALCCVGHCAGTARHHFASSISINDGKYIVLLEVNYLCQIAEINIVI